MRHPVTIATSLVAAGVLLAAVPVGAATNSGNCDGTGPKAGTGQGQGPGAGSGQGRNGGRGPGANAGQGLLSLPMGTLTVEQQSSLAYMAEEEKLARDAYTVFSKKYPKSRIFKMISTSEQRHMSAIQTLLGRYGLPDPTTGNAADEFESAELQAMYNDLIKTASTRTKALQAGVAIEEDDIAELAKASDGVDAPDVARVYSNLTRGSHNHLAAFQSRL